MFWLKALLQPYCEQLCCSGSDVTIIWDSSVHMHCWVRGPPLSRRRISKRPTHLTDGRLQHGVQASFRCIHVPGDALALDHTRELAHVPGHAEDVVETVGRTTADLIVTGDEYKPDKNHSGTWSCCFCSRRMRGPPEAAHPLWWGSQKWTHTEQDSWPNMCKSFKSSPFVCDLLSRSRSLVIFKSGLSF